MNRSCLCIMREAGNSKPSSLSQSLVSGDLYLRRPTPCGADAHPCACSLSCLQKETRYYPCFVPLSFFTKTQAKADAACWPPFPSKQTLNEDVIQGSPPAVGMFLAVLPAAFAWRSGGRAKP